ncbi:hypothetical protein BJ944DRAFT_287970 [Cunninghamella echinulata]|nr:hypothetical protein BJ944DRAFT_287970 [Cunninghamella echinulata]
MTLRLFEEFSPYGQFYLNSFPHLIDSTSPIKKATQYHLDAYPFNKSKTEYLEDESLIGIDEELYIVNGTVVWSLGRQVLKTFKYDNQHIESVLFTWFPQEISDYHKKQQSKSAIPSNGTQDRYFNLTNNDIHNNNIHIHNHIHNKNGNTINVNNISKFNYNNHQKDKHNEDSMILQKAACIVLKDAIHIHFRDGFNFTITLPCPIQHVIPLPIGLLLEPGAKDFYLYITQPMQQLKSIYLEYDLFNNGSMYLDDVDYASKINTKYKDSVDIKNNNNNNKQYITNTTTIQENNNDNKPVNSHQLVFATTTEKEMEWVIFTRKKSNGLHYAWKFIVPDFDEKIINGDSFMKEDDVALDAEFVLFKPPERKRKSDALSVITNTRNNSHSTSNKKRATNTNKNKRSNNNTTTNNSNNNNGIHINNNNSANRNNNINNNNNSPNSFGQTTPTPSPGLSRSESFLSLNDGSSILSDTYMQDSFMEGSIFNDALSNRIGSNKDFKKFKKLEMRMIWHEQNNKLISPPTSKFASKKKPTRTKKPRLKEPDTTQNNVITKRSFGFISYNIKGNKMVCLMNYDDNTLSCLDLNELTDINRPNGCQLTAQSALPILVSPSHYWIVYLNNHKLFLFKDPLLPPLPLPLSDGSIVYDIKDQVGDRFNVVVKQLDHSLFKLTTKTLRYQFLQPIKSVLINDCMRLLKNIWSTMNYSILEHQYQLKSNSVSLSHQFRNNHNCHHDAWDQWVLCLLTFLLPPLVEVHSSSENEKIDKWLSSLYSIQQSKEFKQYNYKQTLLNPKEKWEMIFKTLKGLHLLYEDFSLTILKKNEQTQLGYLSYYLFKLLKQSVVHVNDGLSTSMENWLKYYENQNQIPIAASRRDLPYSVSVSQEGDELTNISTLGIPFHYSTSIHYNRFTESIPKTPAYPDIMTMEESMMAFRDIFGLNTFSKVYQPHGFLWKMKLVWFIYYYITSCKRIRFIQEQNDYNLQQKLDSDAMKFMIDIILRLIDYGYRREDILKLRYCRVLLSFFYTLDYIQLYPPLTFMIANKSYHIDFYRFIGRDDMVMQLELDPSTINKFYDQHNELFNTLKPLQKPTELQTNNINTLIESALPNLDSTANQAAAGAQKKPFNIQDKVIKGDGRLEGISELLDPTRLIEIGDTNQPDTNSRDLQNEYQYQVRQLAHRTLSLPIGLGFFNYRSRLQVSTITDFVPFNLSVRLSHYRTTVHLNTDTFTSQYLDWPHFHYGVSASLSISKDPATFNSVVNAINKLLYLSSDSLTSYHGGVLFGLGFHPLNPLKEIPGYLSYKLMTDIKSTLVIMGYVLGMAISYRRTSDISITKILSVFLPTLKHSSNTGVGGSNAMLSDEHLKQATCIFSLGLVYMGSNNRDMAYYLLKQIGHYANTSIRPTGYNGAASLSSGFALGMLFLGQGEKLLQTKDTNVYEQLHHYVTGEDIQQPEQEQQSSSHQQQQQQQPSRQHHRSQQNHINNSRDHNHQHPSPQTLPATSSETAGAAADISNPYDAIKASKQKLSPVPHFLEITSPAACVAIGLMYLKTNNLKMYRLLDVVDKTRPYLDYVRPDSLLIRVVCKNLIMWDDIQPTIEWVDAQLPTFMQQYQRKDDDGDEKEKEEDDEEDKKDKAVNDQVILQAKYHMIAGGCLCIGLKYAGTSENQVFKFLLNQLDFFTSTSQCLHTTSFQENLTKKALGTCIDVLITAVSMVMAGTGNQIILDKLKDLRQKKFKAASASSASSTGESMGSEDYSHYVSVHMSIGLLFLGRQGYTLSTRTMEGILGLLASFYPFYPLMADDNRYHLQSLRHLWMLAVDTRWFIPVDINTMDIVKLPIIITSAIPNNNNNDNSENGGHHNQQRRQQRSNDHYIKKDERLIAPIVLPNEDDIMQLSVDSDQYLPIVLRNINKRNHFSLLYDHHEELANDLYYYQQGQHDINDDYYNAIRESGVLFVQKKECS